MKLTKKIANDILNSMFDDYSFNFEIEISDDSSFYFKIDTNKYQDCTNEEQTLLLYWYDEWISIYIITKSENNEFLGKYYLKDQMDDVFNYSFGEFEKNDNFWKTMFIEHLLV